MLHGAVFSKRAPLAAGGKGPGKLSGASAHSYSHTGGHFLFAASCILYHMQAG
jgi:hypothetical protein